MKLKDWISNIGPSSIDKCAEKFLNIEIEKEYSSYPNFEEYISIIRKNTKFKTKYTYSFVLLKMAGVLVGMKIHQEGGHFLFPNGMTNILLLSYKSVYLYYII